MHTYKIHDFDGPLTIELNGELWIIDTGSPWTMGPVTSVSFGGEVFPVQQRGWANIFNSVRDGFGLEVDGLMGNDTLNQLDLLIDLPSKTVVAATEELTHQGTEIPLDFGIGAPVFRANFDGFPQRAIFDTGAHISYVDQDLFPADIETTRMADHSPIIGPFATDVCTLLTGIAGKTLPIRCGTLPPGLDGVFAQADVRAVLGLDFCKYGTVGYFPRRNVMLY